MDIPTILEQIQSNWGVITASVLAIIAGADKIFLIAIKTLGNIRDAWRETFSKKD